MQVTSLYICPWSLEDPLCQSQTLPYLRGLSAAHGYKFALITFENAVFALKDEQAQERREELEKAGIYWYPTSYHPGGALLPKALDTMKGVFLGLKIYRKHLPQIVHSRSSLPNVLALSISKLCRLKFLYDSDSVLSEEYADNGHWSRTSNGFKIMSISERLARRHATRIIVLSELLKQDFQDGRGVKTPIDVIPCCVEIERFSPDSSVREIRRRELNLTDEKLLVYVGKVGGRYLVEEIFDFFKLAQARVPSLRLLIVSQEKPETFAKIASEKSINSELYFVRSAKPVEVSDYLAAADAGLAFMRNVKSERGSSPIKIAEYLASGLPVVITEGVGDCSRLINEEKVGAVIEQIGKDEHYLDAINTLSQLWQENPSLISTRCRQVAEEKFSLKNVGIARYRQIYEKLLCF